MDAEEAALAQVGQTIADKYRLLSLLGAGGMGAVYEAEHVFTKRRVAVKRMHHGIAKSKLAAERFVRESQAPSSIGHPGIVQVLDGGFESDGSLYLVLELLEGVSLREALEEEALDPANVVQVCVELLEALAAAHDKGFIHRDIKPDNIFLSNDGRGGVNVKLLDFGIASVRNTEGDVQLTQTGAVLGTPLYMSPEQAKGHRVDARSDLWSVGALLYRALCGASPFSGDSYNALIVSIVTKDHTPLSERRDDLPALLVEVVERALQKDVEHRFASANDMLEALRRVRFGDQDLPPARVRLQPQKPARAHSIEDPFDATRAARRAPRPATGKATSQNEVGPTAPALPQGGMPTMVRPVVARPARPVYTPQPVEQPGNGLLLKLALAAVGCALLFVGFVVMRAGRQTTNAPQASAAVVAAVAPEPQQPAATAGKLGDEPAQAIEPKADDDTSTPQPTAAVGLTPEVVTGVLAQQQAQMQTCLEETVVAQMIAGSTRQKPLRLDIELHIAPGGHVAHLQTTGDVPAELERCVRKHLEAAVFPTASGPTAFRYPLIFQSTVVGN